VTACSLAAIVGLRRQPGVALAADHLVALVLAREGSQRGLDLHLAHAATSQAEHQVQSRLLLDVVVRQRAAILELLTSEDESLLIRRDAFLILDLGLDVLDGVGALDVQGNGLTGQGLHENLHFDCLFSMKSEQDINESLAVCVRLAKVK